MAADGAPSPERTLTEVVSGLEFQSEDTRRLQQDSFANPGLLWVDRGLALWQEAPPGSAPSCAGCHGAAPDSMRGVATRYPRYDDESGRLVNLTQRINRCRTIKQKLPALPYESDALLALATLVGHQSRGLPFDVTIDGPARPFFDAGRRYFHQRRGQMNLACHHCHDYNVGRMLRGDRLSQGHGNGYPAYRLEWQTIGSLHRRLRFCNQGVRAEPFAYGTAEYVNLELFLAWRAATLPVETPAVRR